MTTDGAPPRVGGAASTTTDGATPRTRDGAAPGTTDGVTPSGTGGGRLSPVPSAGTGGGPGAAEPPVLVACDLDRTLIYSAAALRLPAPGPGEAAPGSREAAPDPALRCVEHYRSRPQSYVTATAAELLAQLTERVVFVPATTRTIEQYRRVRLPGRPSRYAVCANGGRLLVDGVSDASWERRVSRALAAECAPFGQALAYLERAAGRGGWPHRVRSAEDLFCYLVAEPGDIPPGWTAELTDWAAAHGWTVSTQGRKTYLVPRPLTKEAAVAEVARRVGAGEVLAAGDAFLDAGLLAAADRGWRPGHGELAAVDWTAPAVTALSSRGAGCAEEILHAMLYHVERVGTPDQTAGAAGARVRTSPGPDHRPTPGCP